MSDTTNLAPVVDHQADHTGIHNAERAQINYVTQRVKVMGDLSGAAAAAIAAAQDAQAGAQDAQAAAELATSIAEVDTTDDAVDVVLQLPGGKAAGTLSDSYARGVSVTSFGAKGDGVTNDQPAIQAALDSLPDGGGMVFFPNPVSFYALHTSLDLPNGATLVGESSTATILRMVGPHPLFDITELRREWTFQDLSLQSVGGHMFELGANGGMALCSFMSCSFIAYASNVSVVHQDGVGDFIGVKYRNCDFTRFSDSTVPGFDMRNTNGAINGNNWEECRVTSNNAQGTPYWRIRADAVGTYCDQNRWKSIIGQLNPAGLIHVDSPLAITVEDVLDYDVPGSYTGSLVRIGKAAGGFPGPIKASVVGNRGGTMNGTTIFQLEVASATTSPAITDRVSDSLGVSKVKYATGYGASDMSASGVSAVLTKSTASKVLDPTAEGTVFFDGANLTATLPDPASVRPGRVFRVKNLHSTALTVTSGVTIDGAGTKSLAQYAAGTYVSDGSAYFTL